MAEQVTASVPAANEVVQAPDPEAAQWAALEKELSAEEGESEPEPAAKAKAEGEPEPKAEGDPEPKPKPTYEELESNYRNTQGALKQARELHKQSQQQLQTFNQFVEQMRAQRGQQTQDDQAAAKAPAIPGLEEDPVGHFQGKIAVLEQALQQAQQGTQQTAQQLRAQNDEQQFWNAVVQSEEQLRKSTPVLADGRNDYDAACQHLEGTRIAELALMLPDDSAGAHTAAQRAGLQSPAQLRAHLLNQDRIAVAQQAFQLGMSPAQLYYNLAKQRGYTPAAAAGNGAKPVTHAQIDAARRGQKAALTISGGGGGKKSVGDMSVSDLTDLYSEDPEAADKIFDQMAKKGMLG